MATINVSDSQLSLLKDVLNASDELCTSVISSKPGTMLVSLRLAHLLTSLHRQGFLKDVK